MLLPALLAVLSVAAGAALGLVRGDTRRLLRSAQLATASQLAALVAAVGVALLQLLPEALEALGPRALGVFALPLLPLLRRASRPARLLTAELGYAFLLLHQVMDGALLGAYGGLVHPAREHAGLLAAIALHTVPIAAAIALRFEQRGGRRSALVRAAGMAAASLAGIALAGGIPADLASRVDPWASAVIAGLLLETVAQSGRGVLSARSEPKASVGTG